MEESCGNRITKPLENVLAGKCEIGWVVDFGPWKSRRAGRAYHDSFVTQVLYGHVEKLVDPAGLYQTSHRSEEAMLYSQGNGGHWLSPVYSIINAQLRLGGWRRCFANDTRKRCSRNRA
jgi:hypothetical protein